MKIELIPSDDKDRYLVTHSREIERILRGVMDSKSIVGLYAENSRDFILTAILQLDPARGYLLLEQGVDQEMNERLRASPHVTLVTTLDQVQIQFTCGAPEPARFDSTPAFRLPMPGELLRLQRREYYRLVTSVINPVKCMINTGSGFLETVVVDISIGGVGVLAYQGAELLRAGETYHGCRIALPGAGEFALSLSVRTTFDIALKNGRITHRAGCHFIDLPASVETEIQRYIIRVERERRARYL